MKNRAKCKLCRDIIESFHQYDYVTCKCGEIAVDGGPGGIRCSAKDWKNFLRIDDEGNEIEVRIEEFSKFDLSDIEPYPRDEEYSKVKLTKKDLVDHIQGMIYNIERLPPEAMMTPITHYDWVSLLMLLSSIFRADD